MDFSFVFLCASAASLLYCGIKSSAKVRDVLKKHTGPKGYLPRAITMLVLSAQLSEMIRVVEHVSPVNVAAAIFLLAIVVAGKSGTESDLY